MHIKMFILVFDVVPPFYRLASSVLYGNTLNYLIALKYLFAQSEKKYSVSDDDDNDDDDITRHNTKKKNGAIKTKYIHDIDKIVRFFVRVCFVSLLLRSFSAENDSTG